MLFSLVLTAYFWLSVAINTLLTYFILKILKIQNKKDFSRVFETLTGNVLKLMILSGVWFFKITDKKNNLKKYDRYIFVANHASFIDSLVLTQIPHSKKYIMARKFTQLPFFGWLTQNAGNVPVDDKDPSTTKVAFDLMYESMEEDKASFVVFPEGKRSNDPYKVLPFKTGAFRLAQKTKVPVLPLTLRGTGIAMPIGGFCHRAKIEIVVGDPIFVGEKWEDVLLAKSLARNQIAQMIKPPIMNPDMYCKLCGMHLSPTDLFYCTQCNKIKI